MYQMKVIPETSKSNQKKDCNIIVYISQQWLCYNSTVSYYLIYAVRYMYMKNSLKIPKR